MSAENVSGKVAPDKRFSILVVDDEPKILDDYRYALESLKGQSAFDLAALDHELFDTSMPSQNAVDHNIVYCNTGEKAVKAVLRATENSEPFSVAFIDMRMPPGINGITTAEKIRSADPDIEIVIVTAFSDVSPEEILSRVGPAHKLLYLNKPFSASEIRQFALALTTKWSQEIKLKEIIQKKEKVIKISEASLVTEKKITADVQQELQATKELQKALYQATSECILIHKNEKVIDSNLKVESLYGYSIRESIDKSIFDYFTAESQSVVRANIESKNNEPFLCTAMRKDGSSFEAEVVFRPTTYKNSNVQLTTVRDISETTSVRMALLDSIRRYELVAKNATDVIWVMDTDNRFTFMSPSVKRVFGYTAEQAKKVRFNEVLTNRSMQIVTAQISKSRQLIKENRPVLKEPVVLELEVYRKDGTLFWTESSFDFMKDEKGKVIGVIGVTRDISKRKEAQTQAALLQSQLQQSQKMEAIGRLAGGIAHDFNNLLCAIQINVEIALETRHREEIMEIKKSADRATELTRRLVAFSKKQIIEPEILDINFVIHDARTMFERLIGEHIRVNLKLQKRIGHIQADPGQVHQILVNLIVNARDSMPTGGTLTISTEQTRINRKYRRNNVDARPGDYIAVKVSDTGTGIEEDILPKIFEPFFTTKREEQGTGFGLATVYGIIKQNNGFIEVESEVGKGSLFTVYLPVSEKERLEMPAKSPERSVTGTETILVLEDELSVQKLIRRILENNGYKVLTASTGSQALEIVDELTGTVDLLLADIVLPQKNGPEIASQLMGRFPSMKVLFTSGYSDEDIKHFGVLRNSGFFIQKPFTSSLLLKEIRKVLEA